MTDVSELTIPARMDVFTYPSLGTVVGVGSVNGGQPFVIRKDVDDL